MKANKIIALTISVSALALGVFSTSELFAGGFEKADAVETFPIIIDMNEHGVTRTVDAVRGTTVREFVKENIAPDQFVDGDYYLIGFNEARPLKTDEEGLDRFYRACLPFQNTQITRSMGISAGWAKIPEEPNVFNKVPNRTTNKVNGIFNAGEFYLSNMQIPSLWVLNKYDHYKVSIEASELVNVNDSTDKAEFDIFTNVYKTTGLTAGSETFRIFENEEQVDTYFYKNSGTKEFVYIDGYGTAAEYNAIGAETIKNKLVIVNNGSTTAQDKFDSATIAGAKSLLVINDTEDPLIMDISGTDGYCVGSLISSAADKLKEIGTEDEINGVTIYQGTVDIAKKRENTGIPYQDSYRLNYGKNGNSEAGSIYIQIKNPDSLTEDAFYELSITYDALALDAGGDFTQAGLALGETTTIRFHAKGATPVDPDDPVEPDVPVEPDTPKEPTKKSGLPAGAIVGIVIGSVLILGVGGFAIFWFVIKKKSFKDLADIFKKKK